MLLAASDSAVAKNPKLRFSMCRSSEVSASAFRHCSISRCMLISFGIQWLAHPARYFSHAQWYLIGISWLTSARQLIIRLSSTLTRRAPVAPVFGFSSSFSSFQSSVVSIVPSFPFGFIGRPRNPDRQRRRP